MNEMKETEMKIKMNLNECQVDLDGFRREYKK